MLDGQHKSRTAGCGAAGVSHGHIMITAGLNLHVVF